MEVDVKSEPTSPVKREKSPVKSSPVKSHKDEALSDDDVPLVSSKLNIFSPC